MKTRNKLLFILISLCISFTAHAASPSWIYGETGPSGWTINPPNPGETDVIFYSGPLGVITFLGNSCMAEAYLGGTPMISIDNTNKIVELWFQGPAPTQCILIYQPVCGLQGNFGPLTPGNWTFKCTKPSIAFEIQFTISGSMGGTTYYVDKDAPGPFHNGTSWKWAFTNIQDALDVATAGDTILVAEGTYKPDEGGSVTPGDRTASFQLQNGVILLGSYAGYGQPNPDARDINTYTTFLSGDLNGDDSWANKNDNSYNVVSFTDCTSCSALLDGFTITGGQADGPIPYNSGGGVHIDNAKPMLINCTISGNTAILGGGISSHNNSLPSILNCKITGNNALVFGGGLYCYSNNINLTNCLIAGNSSYQAEYIGGSAIFNLGGSLNISNCTIMENIAPNGMAITSITWQSPAGNYLTIYNSILYNGGNEILTNHTETTSISYTDIQGGWSGSGTGNINKDPLVVDLGAWTIGDEYIVGDFHLQVTSPCIDQGNNSLLPNDQGDLDQDGNTSEQLPVDLDQVDRIMGTRVDMGAYESTGTVVPQPPDPSWQYLYTIGITHTKIQENPSATLSNTVMVTLPIPIQGYIKLGIEPTSPAGGNWSAWLDPDPGVVGPGSVTMTIHIQGTNIDLTQFPSGPNQDIADLKIYVQPL